MNPPPIAANKPPHRSVSKIDDDSCLKSEILFALSHKTLKESELQLKATRSCISDLHFVLNLPLRGESIEKSETPLTDSMGIEASMFDSIVEETEFDSDFVVAEVGDSIASLSEILFALSLKTLKESEQQIEAMRSCISDLDFLLNLPLRGESIEKSETLLADSMGIEACLFDSIVEEMELDSDFVVADVGDSVASLSNSVVSDMDFQFSFSDSVVCETEFQGGLEVQRSARKRSAAEMESQQVPEMESQQAAAEVDTKRVREAMLRILLPAYFTLVRSFLNCG